MKIRLITLLTAVVVLSGCAGLNEDLFTSEEAPLGASEQDQIKIQTRLNNLNFTISQIAEQGTCNMDAQCRTIAVGSRPCGGARSYYAYSTMDSDTGLLMSKVNEYNRLERSLVSASTEVSNCRILPDPGAQCIASRCSLRPIQ